MALSQEGYHILVASRSLEELQKLQKELPSTSLCLPLDLSNPAQITEFVGRIHQTPIASEGLGALINNAGIISRQSFDGMPQETWTSEMQTNLLGPVQLTRELKPLLLRSQNASVINISSTLGLRPIEQTSSYSASKAAINSWTQSLALEWSPEIRVNAICPGLVDTPIHGFHSEKANSQIKMQMHQMLPMKRMGVPQDIAEVTKFLVSENASWITGALWTVDGGISLR
ncbi:MAG: SDR family oxidoreductase [Bdellovibrionales bacterium]|nr:SDR family oxidoreductase [Bdellovibrionales bacterium]